MFSLRLFNHLKNSKILGRPGKIYNVNNHFKTSVVITDKNNEIAKKTETKSQEQLKKLLNDKVKEYQETIMTQPAESNKINAEVDVLEAKLRKAYGFGADEDLSCFPEFNFKDPIIDIQQESVKQED